MSKPWFGKSGSARLPGFFAVLFLVATLSAQENAASLKLGKTIPLEKVKGRIDHLAVDVAGQRLFVAALGNDTVEVVDLKAGKRIQSVTGLAEPQGIAYVPEFKKLFVANGSDGTCRVLDSQSFKTIATVPLGDDADNVRYDEKAKQVYVGYGEGGLAVIDARNDTKIGDINLAAHPESFRLETNGSRIFVNVPGADEIAVVDRDKKAVTETWPVKDAKANFPLILDEANHRLFVGCRRPARLLTLEISSGKVVGSVEISGDTDDLFYDAKRQQVYVSGGAGYIDVINEAGASPGKLRERIPTASGARTSLFSPELDELYLAVRAGMFSGNAEIRVYKPQ
jgi:DNA-binding beta-propeller fold protein YncE